eukprot:3042175-Rhodomonas_salina.1
MSASGRPISAVSAALQRAHSASGPRTPWRMRVAIGRSRPDQVGARDCHRALPLLGRVAAHRMSAPHAAELKGSTGEDVRPLAECPTALVVVAL